MELKEFKLKLKEKKVSNQAIEKLSDFFVDYINKNNVGNINGIINLIVKVDGLDNLLNDATFKVNSNGFVVTKNLPKLIETMFDLMNEMNLYYLEQTKINEIVKYLNGKLSPLLKDSYFDKKILKRIFYNIKNSKIKLSHEYKTIENHLFFYIKLNIVTSNEGKKENFDVLFYKKILPNDDFEKSKWLFSFWTLNDFVNNLKACSKWLKTN